MPDPVTMAAAIATLAFQEFVKSGVSEWAKKFTTEDIATIGAQLRDVFWYRLTEKYVIAKDALAKASAGEQEGIDTVAKLLIVELENQEFAELVNNTISEIILKEDLAYKYGVNDFQEFSSEKNLDVDYENIEKFFMNSRRDYLELYSIENQGNEFQTRSDSGSNNTIPNVLQPVQASYEIPRYLQSEVPERVKLNTRFNLLVRVVLDNNGNKNSQLKPFSVPPQGINVKISISSPGFTVISGSTQQVFVPPDTNSDPLLFEIEATQAGLRKLEILAFNDGAYLGSHFVQISVESLIQTGPPILQNGLISARNADDGETTLTVKYDLDTKRYRYVLRSKSIGETDDILTGPLARPREELVQDFVGTLNAVARGNVPMSSIAARALLKGKGMNLWKELIPDELKRMFWEHKDGIKQMRVICGQDPIPWEVLYPTYKDDVGKGFLAEQFPVTRWRSGPPASSSLKMSKPLFVLPDKSPTQAENEILKLKAKLKGGRLVEQLDALLIEFQAPQFNLLHFACHNTFRPDKPDSSSINMGGSPFMPDMLASFGNSMKTRSPLVFMNACRTAGSAPTYTQLSGWADKFLDAGASAFIGSLWEIRDSSAPIFAESVYDSLLSGATLGDSVLGARKAIQEETGDPTWLAYALYGDPNATITEGE